MNRGANLKEGSEQGSQFPEPFQLIMQGQLGTAFDILSMSIVQEPGNAPLYTNRGICLLKMHRLEDALSDFLVAYELQPDSDGTLQRVGVVLWWLQRPLEAVALWQQALGTRYTDAAGRVVTPALLFFAATRLNDKALMNEAKKWLRRRWKPRLLYIWPGPIAGYLLDKVDEHTFLINHTFLNSILEARRLAQAYFWVGIKHYAADDKHNYISYLRTVVQDRPSEQMAVILEREYWLAKAEIELLSEDEVISG